MIIEKDISSNELLALYENGQKEFHNIDIEDGNLKLYNLQGIVFKECILAVDFTECNLKDSQFINSNLKTSNFTNANLEGSKFINNAVCSTDFKGAKINNVVFEDNYFHSAKVDINDLKKWV